MAKEKRKSTFTELELEDGSKVKLTLAFIMLLGLRQYRRDVYERYNRIQVKGATEELDMVTVLYAAYLCEWIYEHGDADGAMVEREFIEGCGTDRAALAEAYKALTNPKAAKGSGRPS